ncbi:hypothetical protein G9A89_010783 [Geosiphon pyriformis]|nr:hypothetical protein G9A89_010783 [Geosiphon pyriformis]
MVPVLWKRAWMSMIPKPYDWDRIFTNTRPIALIKTARKILSKVLSDRISMACSKFNVLRNDNFLVLKDTSTQSPVFAVSLVIEDAIEKNRKLWLVLQDMWKAYNSVGWHHLRASLRHVKMYERFIRFFGDIHKNRVNRVMTDFGLSSGYKMHDGLDQDESGRIESSGGLTSYFLAGVFVDDTIWVGNCQTSTQYALNIASEFFVINDISINSKKTVAILINQDVKIASLSICGQPISIAKKGEAHQYLSIFLSTERLFKPSVAKTYADMHFFINVVLRKAITDKQFSYLVSAVLQPIVSYHIQFSFVSSNVCHKSKICLPHNFLDAALHYPSLYGLKPFEQVQSERKIAALIMFFNAFGILGHLFRYRFLDLQVLGWAFLDPLQFPVRLHVSPVNNFLAGMVKILLGNELFLVNNLPTAFHSPGYFLLSSILGKSLYFNLRLNLRGPVPYWFLSCSFSGSIGSAEKLGLDILEFGEFFAVKDGLHNIWSGFFEVFTNGFLRNAGSAEVTCGVAAYFPVLNKSIGIAVSGLLSSTIAKLQAVALALENKDLSVSWVKIKSHSGIPGNVEANLAAGAASGSLFSFCANVHEHFLVAKDVAVSGNACYFVKNIFRSVCCACWEAGPSCDMVLEAIIGCIDWVVMAKVWHPDSHMLTGFTSWVFSTLHTYIMKAVHRRLLVAVRKRLYNKRYPSVLCLFCSRMEFSDHTFTCVHKSGVHGEILAEASVRWSALACGFPASTVFIFEDKKMAAIRIVDYVRFVVELHRAKVWLARASHQMVMEKAGLVCDSGVVFGLSCDVFSVLSDGVVRLLGVANSFAVSFGYQKSYCFFSGLGGSVRVIIGV